MRIIALGDTHGRTDWKQITARERFDKVVFIGDYFDTHEDDISPEQQKENFKDIITYKQDNMDKVVLLFGNHDFHYLRTINEHYSGYQQRHKTHIQKLLHAALDKKLLQICFVYKKILFSHAGLTKNWSKKILGNENSSGKIMERAINDLFYCQPNCFSFTAGTNGSPYGDDIEQSPIWIRPKSLWMDKIPNYIQVVGHTTQDLLSVDINAGITFYKKDGTPYQTSGVVFIDTLGTSGEYLIIDNSKMSVGKNVQ